MPECTSERKSILQWGMVTPKFFLLYPTSMHVHVPSMFSKASGMRFLTWAVAMWDLVPYTLHLTTAFQNQPSADILKGSLSVLKRHSRSPILSFKALAIDESFARCHLPPKLPSPWYRLLSSVCIQNHQIPKPLPLWWEIETKADQQQRIAECQSTINQFFTW